MLGLGLTPGRSHPFGWLCLVSWGAKENYHSQRCLYQILTPTATCEIFIIIPASHLGKWRLQEMSLLVHDLHKTYKAGSQTQWSGLLVMTFL